MLFESGPPRLVNSLTARSRSRLSGARCWYSASATASQRTKTASRGSATFLSATRRTVPSHYSSQLSRCRSRQGRLLYFDDPCADPNLAGELCDQLFAISSPPLAGRKRIDRLCSFAHVIWSLPGGLFSYGPSLNGLMKRAADYVDQIARGKKTTDLPIEQPTKFELIVNLKTAKSLGVTISQSFVLLADGVIE